MVDQAASLREMMNRRQDSTSETRFVAVASGKGGVGKSMFTVNLALALSQRDKRTLIIDADFGLANVDVMLGVTPRYNLSHVLRNGVPVREAITYSQHGVQFISGGSGVDELMNLSSEQMAGMLESFTQLEGMADIILFDLGAGANDRILQVIKACSEAIIVTTPEPTAILDAYALIKIISRHHADVSINLVVNRAETPREGQDTLQNFINIAQKYLQKPVTPLGYIGYDPMVPRAIKGQTPVVSGHPRASSAVQIGQIAERYLREPSADAKQKETGGVRRFLMRLAGK